MSVPMINCGASKDPLSEKSRAQLRCVEEASMYTRFFRSVGLRCMEISNVAQASALWKVHLMNFPMINCGASKDPLIKKSGWQIRYIEKASLCTRFF